MAATEPLNNPQTGSATTQKVIRLVDYLTRLASLRSKIIRDIDESQNVVWVKDIPKQKGCFAQAWGRDEEYGSDVWIEVQTRQEPELPGVPSLCKDWVDDTSLRDKCDLPQLPPIITKQIENPDWSQESDQPKFIPISERLEDHFEVQREWNRYVEDKWLPWSKEHNTWDKVHKVYSALFAIHQEQIRLGEEYELAIGLGLLNWLTPTGDRVRRHLLVADAILEFEARLGKFTVRPPTEGAKLRPELDMLDIEEQPARAEKTAKALLASAGEDPWEKGCVEGVLQALVHSINPQGEYKDSLEAKSVQASAKPIVEYAPALILRKRSSKGLTEALQRIRERIEAGENIPGEFADLAEVQPRSNYNSGDDYDETNIGFGGEVFFPKPSNEEQCRIVDKIRTANGVLVQGPPGTGKSHTIANLISHLLATGQRTLITAKTPRALQVLEGLVPDELRPLCINLLGSGLEERRSLESSVRGILRKNEEWNEDRAKHERETLERQLRRLREEKAKVDRRLRDIRESETHSQSIAEGAYRGTAARIAEAVNRDRNAYEWFTDAVPADNTCPISASDLLNVLSGLRELTPEKRRELSLELPEAMPSPESVANLFENEARATEEEGSSASGVDERIADLLAYSTPATIEAIRDTLSTFQGSRRRLMASPRSWIADASREAMSGHTSLWCELSRATKDSIASIETLVRVADDTSIDLPDNPNIRVLYEDACALKEYMANGGKLRCWPFRQKPVKERIYMIKTVRVNGRPCSAVDDFSRLADVLRVRIECEKAWGSWVGRSEKTQGPYTLQLHALKGLCDALEDALSLEGLIEKCREAMRQCPAIGEPMWSDESRIEVLIASCRLALARQRKRLAVDEIRSIEALISPVAAKNNAHPVTDDLLRAIRQRNLDGYTQAVNRVQDLEKDRECAQKLHEGVSKMHRLLPRLTDELKRTSSNACWDDRLRQIQRAWHWARARYWVNTYDGKTFRLLLSAPSRSRTRSTPRSRNLRRFMRGHSVSRD